MVFRESMTRSGVNEGGYDQRWFIYYFPVHFFFLEMTMDFSDMNLNAVLSLVTLFFVSLAILIPDFVTLIRI